MVYLGTTSLYALGSSQYNRLRLPAGIIDPEQPEIRFQCIGETTGYGTVQFSADTVRAVENVLEHVQGFKHINSIFGEGHSPRLRKLTAGLNELGFPSDSLLRHNQKRLIYGVPLCEQAMDFLCGRNAKIPDYLYRPEQYPDASVRIVDFWRYRWLVNRLNYEPAMVKLMLTKSWKLSEKIPLAYESPQSQQPAGRETGEHYETPNLPDKGIEFWQRLAMSGSNVTSDELSPEELECLHISQPLEAFIIEHVQKGFSIILTGNAGDGKTHLLKQLEQALQDCGAIVEPDATAVMRYGDVTPILNNWRKAIEQGKPYCLAANEYPLYQLRIKGRDILPVIKEVDRQCRNRLVYGGEEDSDAFCEHVIVIDLSLRNPLAPGFAKLMLDKMLSDEALRHYAEKEADPVFTRNFVRLLEPDIRKFFIKKM